VLRVGRILKDYDRAGAVNTLLAPWGFVDQDTLLTKGGHVGLVYRVGGADYECLDAAQRRDIVHRFEAALRLLDESCRVYQYLCKRRIDPIAAEPCRQTVVHAAVQGRADYLNGRRHELYEIDLYLVVLYEGLRASGAASRLRRLCADPRGALRQADLAEQRPEAYRRCGQGAWAAENLVAHVSTDLLVVGARKGRPRKSCGDVDGPCQSRHDAERLHAGARPLPARGGRKSRIRIDHN